MNTEYTLEGTKGGGTPPRVLALIVLCVGLLAATATTSVVIGMQMAEIDNLRLQIDKTPSPVPVTGTPSKASSTAQSLCGNNCQFDQPLNETTCECMCADGFLGMFCQFPPSEINECDRAPCENNGTCVDTVNDYFCNCTVGFIGRNCSDASCPTDRGYRLWTYPDMTICIRDSLTTVNDYQDADAQCKRDGGHLVSIENNRMRSHLVDIVENHSDIPPNEFTYLDGRDQNGTKVFIDWKGDEAWILWAGSNQIRNGQDCLVSKLTEDFFHWDGVCNTERSYLLCQIDV